MLISDLTVEVRNSTLARVGQILPTDLRGLELALRYNKIGGWKVSLRGDHPLVDTLRAPGSGLIVTGPTGVIISGPTASATYTKTSSDTTGTWEIIGTDDSIILGERLAYPVPSTDDLSLQTAAYDTRVGAAETVVKEYVAANMGASAPASRRITGLTVDTDLGRGETVKGNARFESLGALAESLLVTSSLGFDVIQNGSNLTFNVYEPVDRSATIRMDVDNLRLTSSTYSYTSPVATRVIVGGSGDGAARILLERSSTESVAAETTWGRRIEVFSDSRSSSASVDLAQTGDEILTDKGKTIESISVKPSDDETMALGRDWGLGDKVTVVVGTLEVVKVVSEIAIAVTDDGIKIGATVGDPAVASASDPESVVISSMTNQEARISNLERNEVGVGAQKLVQYVKNATGASMTKGQAVYISGASGSNITVALARANAESTSSKTLGLLAQDLANGDHGYVIVEGTLDGIDTSGLTAGDPMWLSPTTAGAIVYGLAGKPSAPNHLVYLGVVKRVQSNNGSVYVHVQNGFELEELHNVAISSPQDAEVLAYDSATSLWKNEPAAPAGVINQYAGTSAPTGYLLCNGSAISRTTYANLFAVLGTTYGAGNGSTTFNIPDLQTRIPVGYQAPASLGTATITIAAPSVITRANHGLATGQIVYFTTTGALPTGITANTRYWVNTLTTSTFRLSTSLANALAGTSITTSGTQSGTHTVFSASFDLGRSNGEVVHTITSLEMPSHTHTSNAGEGSGSGATRDAPAGGTDGYKATYYTPSLVINATGGGLPFSNMPAYQVVNYIIKT
jgi:microcystin-dependent protein